MNKKQFREWFRDGAPGGLTVETYSPGYGQTRYRFFCNDYPGDVPNYLEDRGRVIFTALGIREAIAFLTGWLASRDAIFRKEG